MQVLYSWSELQEIGPNKCYYVLLFACIILLVVMSLLWIIQTR